MLAALQTAQHCEHGVSAAVHGKVSMSVLPRFRARLAAARRAA
jgi:hypothetical protein